MNNPTVQDVITLIRQLERRVKDFPRSNWTANADPTTNDDADKGYQVGSWWYRPDSNKLWICRDASLGGTVWVAQSALGPGLPGESLLGGLVSYWPLDDAGDVQYDVVGTNHLIDASFNSIRPGKMGFAQAFEFEAPDVAVENPVGMASRDWSVCGWFLQTDATVQARVSGGTMVTGADGWENPGGGFNLLVSYDGQVVVTVEDSGGNSLEVTSAPGAVILERWHFVAVTKNGTSLSLQVDKGATVTGTVPEAGPAFTSFELGAGWGAEAVPSPAIDELGFWNRALTAGEIATLYNQGRGLTYPFAAPAMPGGYAGARIVSEGAELAVTRSSETRIVFDDFETAALTGQFGAQGWAAVVGGGGTAQRLPIILMN